LVCPPVVKSNGVWSNYQFPLGRPMAILEGQSSTEVVTTPSLSGEVRVPILWGFYWGTGPSGRVRFAQRPPIQAPTARQAEWRHLSRRVEGLVTGRDPSGMGTLYTNYLTGIKP
jgi:hypothetical protein